MIITQLQAFQRNVKAFKLKEIHCHNSMEETVSLSLKWHAGVDGIGHCIDKLGEFSVAGLALTQIRISKPIQSHLH